MVKKKKKDEWEFFILAQILLDVFEGEEFMAYAAGYVCVCVETNKETNKLVYTGPPKRATTGSYFFLVSVFWQTKQLQAIESHLRNTLQRGDISVKKEQ